MNVFMFQIMVWLLWLEAFQRKDWGSCWMKSVKPALYRIHRSFLGKNPLIGNLVRIP
ncbi:hypothetical protein D3C76_1873930 [compost metagenome]